MSSKKKSLANKLAKMSDEERARYLQHKADMEEETKRRKEQLIATFMKNKIKKEDAFARLNLAKINQYWHQILRKTKISEMKQNVEHMNEWINRSINLKNTAINKLMEELEQAEFQYSHNFQTHTSHIHNMIGDHQYYMDKMQEQYERDRDAMLQTAKNERDNFLENFTKNEEFLRTLIFGNECKTEEDMQSLVKRFKDKYDDISSKYRIELEKMCRERTDTCTAIWRQIALVLKDYVLLTDQRRLHMAELRRLDAESAVEIANNQDRIHLLEEQLEILHKEFELSVEKHEKQKKELSKQMKEITKRSLEAKKALEKDLSLDNKQLTFLTACCARTSKTLKQRLCKGRQIVTLIKISRKFDTKDERGLRWTLRVSADSVTSSKLSSPLPDVIPEAEPQPMELEIRSEKRASVEKILKCAQLDKEIATLEGLQGFWDRYSKVGIEVLELKREKCILLEENAKMEEIMRRVMENATLHGDTTGFRSRSAKSAPGILLRGNNIVSETT